MGKVEKWRIRILQPFFGKFLSPNNLKTGPKSPKFGLKICKILQNIENCKFLSLNLNKTQPKIAGFYVQTSKILRNTKILAGTPGCWGDVPIKTSTFITTTPSFWGSKLDFSYFANNQVVEQPRLKYLRQDFTKNSLCSRMNIITSRLHKHQSISHLHRLTSTIVKSYSYLRIAI